MHGTKDYLQIQKAKHMKKYMEKKKPMDEKIRSNTAWIHDGQKNKKIKLEELNDYISKDGHAEE